MIVSNVGNVSNVIADIADIAVLNIGNTTVLVCLPMIRICFMNLLVRFTLKTKLRYKFHCNYHVFNLENMPCLNELIKSCLLSFAIYNYFFSSNYLVIAAQSNYINTITQAIYIYFLFICS